nr:MAG TPA: hypothetical protein [Caudoviricetes sp.]
MTIINIYSTISICTNNSSTICYICINYFYPCYFMCDSSTTISTKIK